MLRVHSRPHTAPSRREQLVRSLSRQNDLLKQIKTVHKRILPDQLEPTLESEKQIAQIKISQVQRDSKPRTVLIKESKERVYNNFFRSSFGKKSILQNLNLYSSIMQKHLKNMNYGLSPGRHTLLLNQLRTRSSSRPLTPL